MDVVLEVADTYLFDRLYAAALPLQSSLGGFDPISTLTASLKGANATYNLPGAGLEGALRSSWKWGPASQFFSVQPSEYAYLSQWDRDNFWRQMVSFYALSWYVSSRNVV